MASRRTWTKLRACCGLQPWRDNLDAQVEYSIALFNGTGTPKDEAAAVALLLKAARRGSPIAQNRLARVLATGMGAPKDMTEAMKWHLIAKSGGNGDPGSTNCSRR